MFKYGFTELILNFFQLFLSNLPHLLSCFQCYPTFLPRLRSVYSILKIIKTILLLTIYILWIIYPYLFQSQYIFILILYIVNSILYLDMCLLPHDLLPYQSLSSLRILRHFLNLFISGTTIRNLQLLLYFHFHAIFEVCLDLLRLAEEVTEFCSTGLVDGTLYVRFGFFGMRFLWLLYLFVHEIKTFFYTRLVLLINTHNII